ncbi:hypothetical protein PIB30_049482 [Stylosanthes scabra]|uniref:PB1-like domain-containing protein n=1 Tax=Stylosanthes scabra TaxID=79078 RepID=A0ABU6QGN1_9FABA|nr:hypothetical protein [Stylosanthes scabra]
MLCIYAEIADSKHISLVIHHRGRLETSSNGVVAYVDDETTIVDWVNVDKPSGAGMDLADGLNLLKYDRDVVSMYKAAENNGDEIELYTKHPISVPMVAEECLPTAHVTHYSPPVTPSKRRKNVQARRTPTPKKAHIPKRSLLIGDRSNDPRGGANLFSQPPQTPIQPPEPHEINQTQQGSAESVVPLTNHAPFTSAKVQSIGSMSTEAQNLNQRSSESTPTASSFEVPSDELLTQYVPIPQVGPMSQPSTESHPTQPSVVVNNPTNNEDVQGTKKKRKSRSTKRPPPTRQRFIPNTDPSKPLSVYVPVDQEDYSDEDASYHCYESEELNSIANDDDNQPQVFS